MILILTRVKKYGPLAAGLVVLIIAAGVFWLWRAGPKEQAKADRSNAMQVTKPAAPEPAGPVASTDFFTEYRLERDRARSERSDLLRETIRTAAADDVRQAARESVLRIVQEKQLETEMENLIKAKGFPDAIVFYHGHAVSAVIRGATLTRDEVARIADVIGKVSGVKPEEITISVKP